MPIDWNVFTSALQHSRDGNNLKALAILSSLTKEAESDNDRAAIALGEASCHSQLGNIAKSRELLEVAKGYAPDNRALLSQVALSEASLYAQNREYGAACDKFASLRSEYHDLLLQPEHEDFAMELDSRFACTLVNAGKYNEAVPIFRSLLAHNKLEDRQRLEVFFGIALARTGHAAEAQTLLLAAAKGEDTMLAQTALDSLPEIDKTGGLLT